LHWQLYKIQTVGTSCMYASTPTPQNGIGENTAADLSKENIEALSNSFVASTDRMLAALLVEGISQQKQYNLWVELQREKWTLIDHEALTLSCGQTAFIPALMRILTLPKAIRAGLEREYRRGRILHAIANPNEWNKDDLKWAEAELRQGPQDRLLTRIRSAKNVARIISDSFHGSSLEKLRGIKTGTAGAPLPKDAPVGTVVVSSFRDLTNSHGLILFDNDIRLAHIYHVSTAFPDRLECAPYSLGSAQYRRLNECHRHLCTLGGEIEEERAAVLKKHNGNFPIILGPDHWIMTDAGWSVRSQGFGFRIPYGQFAHVRLDLEKAQTLIEGGSCAQYSVEIRGRIDKDFLHWLSGEVYNGHDPLPDIELIYVFSLPSGREHSFVLKGARNYSLMQHADLGSYSEEDRRIIEAAGAHFVDPYNKSSMSILIGFRIQDYPEDLWDSLAHSEEISDIQTYRSLRSLWDQSIAAQFLESAAHPKHIRAHQEFASEDLTDWNNFRAHCSKRLSEIPDQQPFHPPEYFRVSDSERQELLQTAVPKLFAIFNDEHARVAKEEVNGIHLQRIALGFEGSPQGYPLPIDHMLMDAVIDLRKRQRYVKRVAREEGVPESAVAIPEDIGRSYQESSKFFSVDELPERLAELDKDPRFGRKICLRLYDPLLEERYREYPIVDRGKLKDFMFETNHERMRPAVEEMKRTLRAEELDSKLSSIERLSSKILRQLLTDADARIAKLHEEAKLLEEFRKKEIPKMRTQLDIDGVDATKRDQIIQAAKEKNRSATKNNGQQLTSALERAEVLYQTFMLADFMKVGLRGSSIIDQDIVKCVYAIGANGEPILSFELPGGTRDMRATHSELLRGRCMYAGGELILSRHDEIFHAVPLWDDFDETMRASSNLKRPWQANELNNSTGHYRVWSNTLPYAGAVIFPGLEKIGISTASCRIVDRLAPGLKVRGTGVYRF
jgi:hypothetical protein